MCRGDVHKFRDPCDVRFIPVDERSLLAEIRDEIRTVAIYAIGRTEIEEDAILDAQSGHDEEDHAILLELGKISGSPFQIA